MAKLNRLDLKKLIVQEIKKIMDEEIIFSKDDNLSRGMMSRHNDPGRQAMSRSCHDCGAKMYENESSCSECGAMYEVEETLNEGDCGCPANCDCRPSVQYNSGDYEVLDYDSDNDFIPDHMENLNNTNIMPDEAMSLGIKIGNHKTYKGSYMAKSHLYKVNKYAEKLYHMIPDGHNLEDWMRTKLAQIADDIGEVYHALDHDIYEGDV